MKTAPDIVITIGDPGGIGPEVVAKSLMQLQPRYPHVHFHVVGDAGLLKKFGLNPSSNLTIESIGKVIPYKEGKMLKRYGLLVQHRRQFIFISRVRLLNTQLFGIIIPLSVALFIYINPLQRSVILSSGITPVQPQMVGALFI